MSLSGGVESLEFPVCWNVELSSFCVELWLAGERWIWSHYFLAQREPDRMIYFWRLPNAERRPTLVVALAHIRVCKTNVLENKYGGKVQFHKRLHMNGFVLNRTHTLAREASPRYIQLEMFNLTAETLNTKATVQVRLLRRFLPTTSR